MIEAKIEDEHVKCRCHGNRKQLTMELVGICQAVISGASAGSTVRAQRMKQMLCMRCLRTWQPLRFGKDRKLSLSRGL